MLIVYAFHYSTINTVPLIARNPISLLNHLKTLYLHTKLPFFKELKINCLLA